MKVAKTQKLTGRVISLFAACLVLGSTGLALADTKPHFTVNDGSIFAGGWFYDSSGNCQTLASSYQAPNYGNIPGTKYRGAIMGHATSSPRVGAHSNLDAFALGLIEGSDSSSTTNYGFYSGISGTGPLSFSNNNPNGTASAYWGGFFEGSGAKPDHCIPDYWAKQNEPPTANSATSVNVNAANGKYRINPGGTLTVGGGTVNAVSSTEGRKVTYFIDGDVHINGNITYGARTASNMPKFVMVVRGNIYIAPNVTNLDGWYIAQPSSATNGVVWTCWDINDTTPPPEDIWVRSNCNNTLTFNGAVTARQVNLARVNGGLGSGSPGTSAEVVNFGPEMVVGGPFFNPPPEQGQGLDSLISLPPVF